MKTYPVSLNLEGRICLVVGKGQLIEEKVTNLLAAGAQVRQRERFDPGDLKDAWIVVADVDKEQAERISRKAAERGTFVNIVDKPEFCTFILPSIARLGDLSIAVSTAGKSPTMAALIRRHFERHFEGYGELLEVLGETREEIKRKLPVYADRKCFYLGLLDPQQLDPVCRKDRSAFRELIEKKLEEYQDANR